MGNKCIVSFTHTLTYIFYFEFWQCVQARHGTHTHGTSRSKLGRHFFKFKIKLI